MKAPLLLVFLGAVSLHAGDLTTTVAVQQALNTPRDGVSRHHDLAVNRELKKRGWRILRIWSHSLKKKDRSRLVGRLRNSLC